jgi:hypothetical protein
VIFQSTVPDSKELAPEFAQMPTETKTRIGGVLVNSPHAVEDIWERGHSNKHVMHLRQRFFWPVDLLRQREAENVFVFNPQVMPANPENSLRLHYEDFNDWQGYRATAEMIRRGISHLNTMCYMAMENFNERRPITDRRLELYIEIIDCFSGLFGFRPTMEASIPEHMREEFVRRAQAKKDHEIVDIRRRIEEGMIQPPLMYRSPDWAFDPAYKAGILEAVIKRDNPELLRRWIVEQVPNYFLSDGDIGWWQYLGREVFHPNEMEDFIVWEKREMSSAERRSYTEVVKVICNSMADTEYFHANRDRLFRQYIAAMVYPLMCLRFGMNYRELPDEQTDPVLRKFTERLGWQINEMSEFIIYCF